MRELGDRWLYVSCWICRQRIDVEHRSLAEHVAIVCPRCGWWTTCGIVDERKRAGTVGIGRRVQWRSYVRSSHPAFRRERCLTSPSCASGRRSETGQPMRVGSLSFAELCGLPSQRQKPKPKGCEPESRKRGGRRYFWLRMSIVAWLSRHATLSSQAWSRACALPKQGWLNSRIMSRIFANWKAQWLGCRVNRRCGERRSRSDRASLCAPGLRSDCFRDSPNDPGTVDQDRRRCGREADQKCSCILHAQPPCDGLQVLAGSSPAKPAAFAVGGSEREH
jgi:hypothetical protein